MTKSMPFSVATAAPSPALKSRFFTPSRHAWLMGVVNVTPDSFYAGSRATPLADVVQLAGRMIAEGADVLDIGGESTRPGASPVSVGDEISRVVPVVEALHTRWPDLPLSVDTQKAAVAEAALHAGASVINDISALRQDPDMARIAAEAQGPVILMHMQGTPETMQAAPQYDDVVGEIRSFFEERLAFSEQQGISRDRIILDPGIGFGKSLEHNRMVLQNIKAFTELGRPVLIGVSRKSFIGRILGDENTPLAVEERLEGSIAAGLWAVQAGASGLRVHDVGATRHALRVWESVSRS